MKTSRGQAVLVDFALAFMLFVVVWGFITTQFDKEINSAIMNDNLKSMRINADQTLEYLVKSGGSPGNWHTQYSLLDVNRIGLAISDRELSKGKLEAFQNFSETSSYESLKEVMGADRYDFYFEFNGIDDFNAGKQPAYDTSEVILQRIVNYEGGIGVVTLKVYME